MAVFGVKSGGSKWVPARGLKQKWPGMAKKSVWPNKTQSKPSVKPAPIQTHKPTYGWAAKPSTSFGGWPSKISFNFSGWGSKPTLSFSGWGAASNRPLGHHQISIPNGNIALNGKRPAIVSTVNNGSMKPSVSNNRPLGHHQITLPNGDIALNGKRPKPISIVNFGGSTKPNVSTNAPTGGQYITLPTGQVVPNGKAPIITGPAKTRWNSTSSASNGASSNNRPLGHHQITLQNGDIALNGKRPLSFGSSKVWPSFYR